MSGYVIFDYKMISAQPHIALKLKSYKTLKHKLEPTFRRGSPALFRVYTTLRADCS